MSRGLLPRRLPVRAAACAIVLCAGAAHAQVRGNGSNVVLGTTEAAACATAAANSDTSTVALRRCDTALSDRNLDESRRLATLVNRGAIYASRQEHQTALADFDAAIALDPRAPQPYFNRGTTLIILGRPGEAVAAFTEALGRGVREPFKAYYNRAAAREALGDVRGAYEDYSTALQIEPDWGPANEELARFVRNRRETLSAELSSEPAP